MKPLTGILCALVLTLSLHGAPAPKPNKKPIYFEGKHPVFVVICIPNVYCGGIYMDKKDAIRAGFPKCSAKTTNYCYR